MACGSMAWRELQRENERLERQERTVEHVMNSLRAKSLLEAQSERATPPVQTYPLKGAPPGEKELGIAHSQLHGYFRRNAIGGDCSSGAFLRDDLFLHGFSYLDAAGLGICRAWHDMVMVEGVWEALYGRRAIEWAGKNNSRHLLEQNWTTGQAVVSTLSRHNGTVTCLEFAGLERVTGSDDGSVMLSSVAPRSDGTMAFLFAHAMVTRRAPAPRRCSLSSTPPTGPLAVPRTYNALQDESTRTNCTRSMATTALALRLDGATRISGSNTIKLWSVQARSAVSVHDGVVGDMHPHAARAHTD
ncbi:hypothetical protein H310_13641 [Aphanomyces invadans]|uniref:F-box domain-containing protein n=1 Tax=Aphanomyces invadans TaxID=157072 RepID=A0A024TCR1_9STRA|nr:hypothetical protein H310_13641 [Aphanomyces invadans]ETV91804.1 hypothetical protein H310_13641 [Aphanomyces invadans]|eukprot:XP_008879441.1 hypothetical protein H310_13641 [Aphanomyces invadans]